MRGSKVSYIPCLSNHYPYFRATLEELRLEALTKINLSQNWDNNYMISKIKKEITEESMMKSSPWKTDTNCYLRKKLDLKWKAEQDLTEEWMKSLNAENRSKISNTCFLKRADKTWSSRTNKVDPNVFWTRNSSKQEKIEMKAIPKEIKLLTLDHKPLN